MNDHKPELQRSMTVSYREPPLPKSSLVIWIVGLCLLVLLVWAWLFKLEEVSTGTGKVIASSKEQVIQSLEGGILTRLNVKEGDIVPSRTFPIHSNFMGSGWRGTDCCDL